MGTSGQPYLSVDETLWHAGVEIGFGNSALPVCFLSRTIEIEGGNLAAGFPKLSPIFFSVYPRSR